MDQCLTYYYSILSCLVISKSKVFLMLLLSSKAMLILVSFQSVLFTIPTNNLWSKARDQFSWWRANGPSIWRARNPLSYTRPYHFKPSDFLHTGPVPASRVQVYNNDEQKNLQLYEVLAYAPAKTTSSDYPIVIVQMGDLSTGHPVKGFSMMLLVEYFSLLVLMVAIVVPRVLKWM